MLNDTKPTIQSPHYSYLVDTLIGGDRDEEEEEQGENEAVYWELL